LAATVANALLNMGDVEAAAALAASAGELSRDCVDDGVAAVGFSVAGAHAADTGDLPRASELLDEALERARASDNDRQLAAGLHNRALVAYFSDDSALALTLIDEALDRVAQTQVHLIGALLRVKALVLDALQRDSAAELARESLYVFATMGEDLQAANSLETLALTLARREPTLAAALLGVADETRGRIGSVRRPRDKVEYAEAIRRIAEHLGAETAAAIANGRTLTIAAAQACVRALDLDESNDHGSR
jgi:tetratricopeptide (TPR) repeat protein